MKEKNLIKKNLTSNIQHLTSSKGITLIALVITIIIMLILAGVTINIAINGGLFEYAGKAVKGTKSAVEDEQQAIKELLIEMDESQQNIFVTLYEDGTLTFSKNDEKIEGKEITQSYGNIKDINFEVIPDGGDAVIWADERDLIKQVDFLDEIHPTNTSGWFRRCNQLTQISHIENLDTSRVTDMSSMFSNCTSLTTLDLSHFNTRNVTNMTFMFSNCNGLTSLDLSSFDTSKVTTMRGMFNLCSGLTSLDLSGFDTSKVTTMQSMFNACSSLTSLDLSNFDTSKVTDMAYMFYNCSNLESTDVSSFDTSKVTTMCGMFQRAKNLTTIYIGEGWIVNDGVDIREMFDQCGTQNVTQKNT